MPVSCNINNFINRCADLYTQGRDGQDICAIVLHEYDGPLSQLDNQLENSVSESDRGCHTSFHFGIGGNGEVHQYVEIQDAAWTFPQDWETNQACGVGSWLIAQGKPTIDPNLYTINIAVSTGQVEASSFGSSGSRKSNVYGFSQVSSIIDLVCCLIPQTSPEIAVDLNTVWRHLNELDDFPGCEVETSNGSVATYQDILSCIQNCLDTVSSGIPSKASFMCDTIECLLPPVGTGTPVPVSLDWVQSGLSTAYNILGENYIKVDVSVSALPFLKGFDGGYHTVEIRIDPTYQSNIFTITFDSPQNNLSLDFSNFTALDQLSGFSILPNAATGSLILAGGVVTGVGQGTVDWTGPVTTISFTYSGTVAPVAEQSVSIRNIQSDELFYLIGPDAIPGVTEVIGADCRRYRIPAALAGGDITCDILGALSSSGNVVDGSVLVTNSCVALTFDLPTIIAALPVGAAIVDNTTPVVTASGELSVIDIPVDLCTEITAQVTTDGGVAVPGITQLIGVDCSFYVLPTLCEMIEDNVSAFDPTWNLMIVQQEDGAANCSTVLVDADCSTTSFVNKALGVDQADGLVMSRVKASMPYRGVSDGTTAFDPSTDGVIGMDASAGNVIITLTPPQGCDPNIFNFKRLDTSGNTVTLDGNGDTIDGLATLPVPTPGVLSANAGANVSLFWNGTVWLII